MSATLTLVIIAAGAISKETFRFNNIDDCEKNVEAIIRMQKIDIANWGTITFNTDQSTPPSVIPVCNDDPPYSADLDGDGTILESDYIEFMRQFKGEIK